MNIIPNNHMYPFLYTRTAHGKIAYFYMQVVETDHGATITRQWGNIDEKVRTQVDVVTKGKNIGRANETTPYVQACSDANSIYNRKKDDGYKSLNEVGIIRTSEATVLRLSACPPISMSETVVVRGLRFPSLFSALEANLPKLAVDNMDRIKPMILHHLRLSTYVKGTNEFKKSKALSYPHYVQPKYDGVCCVASPLYGLITRGGKDRHTPGGTTWKDICPQIYEEICELQYEYPLHGEVYLHGETLDDITTAVKKVNPLSGKLTLVIFDIVAPELCYNDRKDYLNRLRQHLLDACYQYLTVAPLYAVKDEAEVLDYEKAFINMGCEGLVARAAEGKYLPGDRSKEVLKLVRFDSMELPIIDVIPMENEPTHGLFVLDFETANGEKLKVTPGEGFDDKKRKDLLKNKHLYIGQQLTIRHRGFTQYGTPRIATGEAIRPIGS